MRTLDLSPLFRHSVGFDRMQRLMNTASEWDANAQAYPPYNIEQVGEDKYRVTLAVAGFSEQDLDVTAKENTLTITGKLAGTEDDSATYLHRGIAGRAFERRFEIADHIKVTGADLSHGLLSVELVREVPEEKKPRTIAISSKAIEHKKAA
ncbi:MAG: Hsp20 family protein [Rhodospirillales bacterium]|nr:Hsp20 family protein [Rhodospirillales bacterium]